MFKRQGLVLALTRILRNNRLSLVDKIVRIADTTTTEAVESAKFHARKDAQ